MIHVPETFRGFLDGMLRRQLSQLFVLRNRSLSLLKILQATSIQLAANHAGLCSALYRSAIAVKEQVGHMGDKENSLFVPAIRSTICVYSSDYAGVDILLIVLNRPSPG